MRPLATVADSARPYAALKAPGPSTGGIRTVNAFNDGRIKVPFGAYAGQKQQHPHRSARDSGVPREG
jgi:hypothetical protein